MNRRLLTILLVAFFIAALCTLLVYRVVVSRGAPKQAVTQRVVAAKTDIKLGTLLSADNIASIEIAGTVPKGAILDKDKASAIGRGVISDLYEGEPIMVNRLAAIGSGGGLAPKIPLGMRACAVKVDEVVDVSGFVTPDMRVDVLVSGNPPGTQGNTQDTQARTLLQNIQVLSAGTEYQKDSEGKPKAVQVVNLLVTPEQAESLTLASNQAKIQLVLRNPLDTKTDPVLGTNTSSLFAGPNAASPSSTTPKRMASKTAHAAAPRTFSIEVINGSKTSEEKFAAPEAH